MQGKYGEEKIEKKAKSGPYIEKKVRVVGFAKRIFRRSQGSGLGPVGWPVHSRPPTRCLFVKSSTSLSHPQAHSSYIKNFCLSL